MEFSDFLKVKKLKICILYSLLTDKKLLGAAFAAVLTEMLENRTYFPELIPPAFDHAPFKFSIIVAGFKPSMQEATNAMLTKENKVKTPSMHFIGELDTLILPEAMNTLAEAFEKPKIFCHTGG